LQDTCKVNFVFSSTEAGQNSLSSPRVCGGGCEPAAAGCPPGDTDLLLLMPAP